MYRGLSENLNGRGQFVVLGVYVMMKFGRMLKEVLGLRAQFIFL
jgi:hypothetical protein